MLVQNGTKLCANRKRTTCSSFWHGKIPPIHIRKENLRACDELSVQNGIIFKGDRCVITSMMRNEIMSQIHTHIEIEGCLKCARECVYWPRMNSELRDYISKCDVCQTYGLKQLKETVISDNGPQYSSEQFKNFSRLWDLHSRMEKLNQQKESCKKRRNQTVIHSLRY